MPPRRTRRTHSLAARLRTYVAELRETAGHERPLEVDLREHAAAVADDLEGFLAEYRGETILSPPNLP
jgi:hypothetical protein